MNITKIIHDEQPFTFDCFIFGEHKGRVLGKIKECYTFYTFRYNKEGFNYYQMNKEYR